MDAMRKQLDVLMGANRNGDVTEVNRKYYDRDVCRLHLSGLCPHELFQLTKMDMGPCPKVHSLQLRKESKERSRERESSKDRDGGDSRDRGRDVDRRSRDRDSTMTTVSMTETIISPVAMTQGAGAVRGPGLGKDLGILIVADAMTATKSLAKRCLQHV